MRPKSSATVVVDLPSTWVVSSTPTPVSVSSSSVRNGWISLTAPTSVVLPTPNPPAITILYAAGIGASESSYSIDDRPESVVVRQRRRRGGYAIAEQSPLGQLGEQHSDHSDGEFQPGGDVHNGLRRLAQPQNRNAVGAQAGVLGGHRPSGQDHGDQGELGSGPHRPGGEREG